MRNTLVNLCFFACRPAEETVPWIGALVTFLVLGGIIALVVVAVVYWKIIYSFFCPKDVMPQHFKQVRK